MRRFCKIYNYNTIYFLVESSFVCPSTYHRVNVEGTRVLLKGAFDAKVDKFVYISTDEVYGQSLDKVRAH